MSTPSDTLTLFAGNANPALAQDIARSLQMPLGRAYVGRFSDGEVNVELIENVRGRDVFIVQSTCPPANDSLMELLVMVDAGGHALGDNGEAGGQYALERGRESPADDRSALGPDPGFFRHPGGQRVCLPGA